MTILVAGNAALLDFLGIADGIPAASEVARLTDGPLARAEATPGGAAFIAACLLAERGQPVRLWHPLPKASVGGFPYPRLARAKVDMSLSPVVDGPVPCCVMIDTPSGRMAWSSRLAAPGIDPDSLLHGIAHVVFAPVWEPAWSEPLFEAASEKGIPVSLFGASVPQTVNGNWHTVVLDRAQFKSSPPFAASTICITDGPRDVTILVGDQRKAYPVSAIEAVDATGAGDTFAANFIAEILAGADGMSAAAAAAREAALTCQFWGAWRTMANTDIQEQISVESRLKGALAGTACGDAFGMPNSFLKQPVWRKVMEAGPSNSPYHAGYPAGRITDDTEQALALTQAFADGFTKASVAERLNEWFVSVGGSASLAVGPSTKRALEAFQRGESVEVIGKFGVTNGAPMRISPIGAMAGLKQLSLEQTADLVEVACWPTHATSPAISGALSVAWAIAVAMAGRSWSEVFDASVEGARYGAGRGNWVYSSDIALRILEARRLAQAAQSAEALCESISRIIGAGEPCTETIPAAMAICDYAGGDPKIAIELAGNLQGDTDTIAAIAGAICGAYSGFDAIPSDWLELVQSVNKLSFEDWANQISSFQ